MYWRVPKGSPSHILQFGEHNLFEAPLWSPAMYTLLFNWSIALTTHDTSSHQDVEFDRNEFLQLIPMCAMKSTSWCSKAWHIYEWAQKYKRKFWETNKQTSLPHIWSQTPSVPFVAVAGLFIISKKNSLIPIGMRTQMSMQNSTWKDLFLSMITCITWDQHNPCLLSFYVINFSEIWEINGDGKT